MPKILTLPGLALLVAAYIGYPYWSAYTLGRALEEGDEAGLRDYVDWESLRCGLQQDFSSLLSRETGKAMVRDEPAQAFGAVVASALGQMMIEPMIDRLVTAEGISAIIRNGGRLRDRDGQGSAKSDDERRLSDRVTWAFFTAPTAFEIVLQDNAGEEVVAEMAFRRLRWQLVRLRLPMPSDG